MWTDLIVCIIGGGIIGWGIAQVHDLWANRPRLYFNHRTGRHQRGW